MKLTSFFLANLLCLLAGFAIAAPPERIVIGAEAGKGIIIVDPADGKNIPLWNYPVAAVHDLHLLPNWNLLSQDGWRKVVEIDLNKKVHWQYEGSAEVEIHAFQRLNDGRSTMIAESGSSRIIEVDDAGNILKQFPLAVSKSSRHSDTRLVRKLKNGHYLVAHEADQTVKEYSSIGEVIRELPVPLFGKSPKKGHGPEAFGGRCFAAVILRNGNYLISTGNGHSLIEVTPENKIVWKLEQNDIPGVTLAWVTTIEERPNGNVMFGNCHAGPDNPQIIEISRNKKMVWSFNDHGNFGNSLANSIVLDGERAIELRRKLKFND